MAATYALMAGAAAGLVLFHSSLYALPLAALYPALIIYVLVTFRLSFAGAGFLRSCVTCFFLSFSDGLLTALLTQQPLHPHFPLLVGEYVVLFLLLSAVPRARLLQAMNNEALRCVFFLITGFIKSNSLGRTIHSIVARDLSLRTVSFAGTVGVVKMMSGPMVYFVDLIAVSGKIEMGKLQRFARVGVVLAGMVICAVICFLWAELHTSTLANLTANLACVVFYATEAKAYGGRLKDS
jgi:hypothetical protein